MKNTMKKLLSLLLVAVMILSCSVITTDFFASTAKATTTNNQNICGENAIWSFENNTLTISGSGAMFDYASHNDIPWSAHRYRIKNIVISEGITRIGAYAFSFFEKLQSISLGSNITEIGKYAFAWCDALASVKFGENITIIDDYAFHHCRPLSTIELPDGLEVIGDQAFSHCYALSNVNIPDSVTAIGRNAFGYCTGLTTVILSSALEIVDCNTFWHCESLKSVFIPYSIKNIQAGAFSCTVIEDVYFDGSQEEWQKIRIVEDNVRLINATIHYNTTYEDYLCRDGHDWSISEDGYYNVCKVCGIQQSGPVFPAGYDFDEDSYNFKNYTSNKISSSYFTTIYEPSSGKALYNIKKNVSSGGLCFGMAYTTAAIYNGLPSAERWSWSKLIGKEYATKIRDIHNEYDPYGVRVSSSVSLFDDKGTLLNDSYIKYAFIYQWSSEARAQFNNNFNDVAGLKSLVRDYANNNRIGVVIGIQHYEMDEFGNRRTDENGEFIGTSGHSILAVGIDGNDILIDDPNNPDGLERLTINNDLSWTYSRPWESDGINSDNSDLYFSTDIHRPYQIILTGTRTSVADGILDNNSTYSDTFVDGMERLDSNHTLITFTDDIELSGTEIVSSITSTDFASSNNSIQASNNIAYWVYDSDEIVISNNSDSNNSIQIARDNTLVGAIINSEDTVRSTNEFVELNTKLGNTLAISFDTVYDYEDTCITIQGTASSDTLSVTQTETGLLVTGISDGTVTLSKNEEVIATKAVTDAISDIEITYDKTGADTSVELEYEQAECEHDDTDGDGKCDACGEPVATPPAPETPDTPADDDNSCSCICHSENSIVQFFYTIFRFLWQLFGMNMDCACGVKHFDFYIFA